MGAIASKWKISVVGVSLAASLVTSIVLAALYFDSKSGDDNPAVLRVAVLPDQSPEILQQRYAPLVAYLSAQTDRQTRLVIPADYYDAINLFGEGKVDLAFFGGLVFVQAQALYGAVPLVMREIDTRFTSWLLVKPELAQLPLAGFRDKRLGFGSRLSASGHLMPRHFLQQQWQINPETFFSEVRYSGAHDKTALLVRDGVVDLGAVNSVVVKRMIADGSIGADEIHVLWQTPPYSDYVWVVQENLDQKLMARLRDAFLALDPGNPADARVLDGMYAKTFLPADPADFKILSEIATRLELVEPEGK